jgi:HD domain
VTDVRHARTLASTMLAAELPRRWRHTRGVAARAAGLDVGDAATRSWLVSAAWLHDVGYASPLVETGFHPIDGPRHLRRLAADESLVNLVAHHSCASVEASLRGLADVLALEFPRDDALPHDELCYCDQTTSPDGDPVTVTERLAEIRRRYPDDHVVRHATDAAEPTLLAIVSGIETRYGLPPSLPPVE